MTDFDTLATHKSDNIPSLLRDDGVLSPEAACQAEQISAELAAPAEYYHGVKLYVILAALLLGMFLVALDLTIVATAIPSITDEFNSVAQVGWYGSAFFLTLAAFQSPWGKAYKYFPLKTAFFVAVLVFEVGSLICGVSPTSTVLIIGRAITGVGGAGVTSGVFIIVAYSAIPSKVPGYLGLSGAVFSMASVAGPLLGGVLTDKVSWRWCFYINLPIGGVALVILLLFFHTPAHAKPTPTTWTEIFWQMDPIGLMSIIASLTLYILALQWGGVTMSWSSADVVGTLVGWISLTVLFCVDQWLQKERALVVIRLLKQRTIAVSCLFIFFLNSANFLLIYQLPLYFQAVDNASPLESGVQNLALICSSAVFTYLTGRVIGKIGYYQILFSVGSAFTSIGAGLLYTLDIGSTVAQSIGFQLLIGFGIGVAINAPIITCQAFSRMDDMPVVTAIVLFFQLISGALSVSASQNIFTNTVLNALPSVAPSVNASSLLATGATDLRTTFAPDQIPGILQAYMQGLHASWAMGIALACISFVLSLGCEWRSINQGNAAATGAVA